MLFITTITTTFLSVDSHGRLNRVVVLHVLVVWMKKEATLSAEFLGSIF